MTIDTTDDATRVHAYADDVLGTLDATGVAEAIAAGEFTSREAADAATARIRTVDPEVAAVRWWARPEAAPPAPSSAALYGVPSAIKENVPYAGLATTVGSTAFGTTPAKRSSPVAEQLQATGLTILASTKMPEFGLTASAEFASGRAPVRNPWNIGYSAGGSSSGAAALVASGALPIAHGNDGGGSIRIPAALNGLVGLKVTRGRMVGMPEMRVLPVNVVCEGVLTRTVRDTARYVAAAERHHRNPALPPVGHVRGAGRRRRIGLVTESVTDYGIADECIAPVRALADELAGQGHEIVELSMRDLRLGDLQLDDGFVDDFLHYLDSGFVEDFLHYWGFLAAAEFAASAVAAGGRMSVGDLDPVTRSLLRSGRESIPSMPGAIRRLRRVAAGYERGFVEQGVDAILSPTMTRTAPKIGVLDPALPFDEFMSRTIAMVGITPLNNVSGGPAISVPCGFDGAGLPLGAQFAGPAGM
ncbi:amidase family protein, partial [Tsukamurella paurometabola]